jgi:hypothetical protein
VVGILGCGAVGQTVARLCRAFGATVLAHDIRAYDGFYLDTGVEPVALDTLLTDADIVSIHLSARRIDERPDGCASARAHEADGRFSSTPLEAASSTSRPSCAALAGTPRGRRRRRLRD